MKYLECKSKKQSIGNKYTTRGILLQKAKHAKYVRLVNTQKEKCLSANESRNNFAVIVLSHVN